MATGSTRVRTWRSCRSWRGTFLRERATSRWAPYSSGVRYDFVSDRSVHDLWFRSLTLDDANSAASLSLGDSNEKRAYGLNLVYSGLVRIVVDRQRDPADERLGQVLLDELRPSPEGFVHEIALTGGSLLVVARNLEEAWG